MILVCALCVQSQNLGLGAGSKTPVSDSTGFTGLTGTGSRASGADDSAPRKSQLNRRLGLSGRKGREFDPKAFEARGRELQGQFYEIDATPPNFQKLPAASPSEFSAAQQSRASKQWMFWAGAAGVTGVSVGALGLFLLNKSHPSQPPPIIIPLDDKP